MMILIEAGKCSGWHPGCWSQTALIQIPALPFIISAILGKLIKLSVPYFLYREKGDAKRVKKINIAKWLEEYLADSKWPITINYYY